MHWGIGLQFAYPSQRKIIEVGRRLKFTCVHPVCRSQGYPIYPTQSYSILPYPSQPHPGELLPCGFRIELVIWLRRRRWASDPKRHSRFKTILTNPIELCMHISQAAYGTDTYTYVPRVPCAVCFIPYPVSGTQHPSFACKAPDVQLMPKGSLCFLKGKFARFAHCEFSYHLHWGPADSYVSTVLKVIEISDWQPCQIRWERVKIKKLCFLWESV